MKAQYLALIVGTALVATPAAAQTGSIANSPGGSMNFMAQQDANQWRADKMIGLNVYDPQNNKVGDIKDILLDRSGQAEAVVIGVGGFLGMGEKNVAVPYNALQWRMESPRSASAGTTTTTSSGGTATGTNTTTAATTGSGANREVPDHAVINMTKDQFNTAPNFQYASSAGSSNTTTQPSSSTPRSAPK